MGGFCQVCRRWVWLNAYGECQFGHPASAVGDVQQLQPRAGDEQTNLGVDATRSFALRHGRGPVAGWRYSLWIGLTFACGLLSWLAFVYIGMRARRIEWLVAGIIYAVPPILVAAFWRTALFWPLVAVALTSWVVSILHAFLVRGQYRAVMIAGGSAGELPAAPDGSFERSRRSRSPSQRTPARPRPSRRSRRGRRSPRWRRPMPAGSRSPPKPRASPRPRSASAKRSR